MKLWRCASCLSSLNSVLSALRQNPALHTPVNLYMAVLADPSSYLCLLSQWPLCSYRASAPASHCFHLYSICFQRQDIVSSQVKSYCFMLQELCEVVLSCFHLPSNDRKSYQTIKCTKPARWLHG